MSDRLPTFEAKIEEYYLSCIPRLLNVADKTFLHDWPLYKFSIQRLHASLLSQTPESIHSSVADKLIDIKLHFAYLLTIYDHFHRGATLIVGNNEIQKLNPNTISVLRGIHYRVYLLSVLFEQILDFLNLVIEGHVSKHQKGKWKKVVTLVQAKTGQSIISDADAVLIDTFKSYARTAELHKYSMVRALTGKDKWTHLHDEEQAAIRILANVYFHYTSHQ